MQKASFHTLVFALLALSGLFAMPAASAAQEAPAPAPPAGKTFTLAGELLHGYQQIQQSLTEAAEKMPDDQYGFKPTPEIKPFGQLVAHVAIAQFRTCSLIAGQPDPRKDEKEETTRTKAEALALLKASTAYCDPTVNALTDASMPELTKAGTNQAAKGLLPASLLAHGSEMHGTMAVYLRLKGLVPPTTERQHQQSTKKNSQ